MTANIPLNRQQKIQEILEKVGEPAYRLKQINHAIYKEKAKSFLDMTSLSKPLRERLNEEIPELFTVKEVTSVTGADTNKVLFKTEDNQKIESVWMNYTPEFSESRESLCVSSQSGCALKCAFCYTGTMGFKKNLSADEITDQVLHFVNSRNFEGSVSFMGMGEPFANCDSVFEAFGMLTDPEMFGFGQRRLNVSTVGLVPGINRLTREFPQINLAFSLHTPFEEQRAEIMPISKAYPINMVMDALDAHILATHRKVFIAYIFLGGVNDSEDHATALAALINARPKNCRYLYHVNLIRFHGAGDPIPFVTSDKDKMKAFTRILNSKGINNTVRQSFGLDIQAACGQLVIRNEASE